MEYLAIGSVVTLMGIQKKAMIIGYQPQHREDPSDKKDYIGVLFPEGFLDSESFLLFDHTDIIDVVFNGYENPESQTFMGLLRQISTEENMEGSHILE